MRLPLLLSKAMAVTDVLPPVTVEPLASWRLKMKVPLPCAVDVANGFGVQLVPLVSLNTIWFEAESTAPRWPGLLGSAFQTMRSKARSRDSTRLWSGTEGDEWTVPSAFVTLTAPPVIPETRLSPLAPSLVRITGMKTAAPVPDPPTRPRSDPPSLPSAPRPRNCSVTVAPAIGVQLLPSLVERYRLLGAFSGGIVLVGIAWANWTQTFCATAIAVLLCRVCGGGVQVVVTDQSRFPLM